MLSAMLGNNGLLLSCLEKRYEQTISSVEDEFQNDLQ